MEGLIGIADRAPGGIVEPEQCPVDLDAVPGRLQIEAAKEANLRSKLEADTVIRRAFRLEIDSRFARGRESGCRIDVVPQQRVRRAGEAETARCAAARETCSEQLSRQ